MSSNGIRPKYPPLQLDELRAIQQRSRTADTRRLLWEIWRLRKLVARFGDFLDAMGRNRHANRFDSVSGQIFDELHSKVRAEPAVWERRQEEDGG
jgi:hypothetical protein